MCTVINSQIASGPMLGYNTMREVAIWVQLENEGSISIQYRKKGKSDFRKSEEYITDDQKANTQTIPIAFLEPGTLYEYQIIVNDHVLDELREFTTQSLWQYRTDPPDFSFLAGSCVFINEEKYDRPGEGYGQSYEIFKYMAREDADLMIWLGDNTYLREADWNSRTGIYHRYTHTRGIPEVKDLLSSMHHYAIWDDHDYGPNDSDYTFWGKDVTREAFTDFWANLNYGTDGTGGITGTFTHNDCQFFMMDNRWNRSPAGFDGKILGDQQLSWLIDGLRSSKASFKFVCIGGQVLSDVAKYENYAVFSEEQSILLSQLDDYDIDNVVFLTGDRHHSEITKYETDDGQVYWDITSSALTSKTYDHSEEPNSHRYKDAIIGENNYAIISIEGKFGNRRMNVTFKDANGKEIKSYKL